MKQTGLRLRVTGYEHKMFKTRLLLAACSLLLAIPLAGCTLGETTMPNPPAGRAADRSVGLVAPIPDPIAHELTEERQECFTCHDIGAVDAPVVPNDHEADVTLCTTCHAVWLVPAIAATTPPVIPHDVEGYAECLVCHKMGVADTPRVPDNHANLTSVICQTCHATAGEGVVAAAPVVAAPLNPHGPEVDTTCTRCHAGNVPGMLQFPDDHQGRTDDMCATCHRLAEDEGVEIVTAPQDPHPPKGFSDCTRCHAEFKPGVPRSPDNHLGRTNDFCTACHRPAGE